MSYTYQHLGPEIGALVDRKRASYGASVEASADFLRLLYPQGIPPDQYVYALLFARTFEKQTRFVTHPEAFGESPFIDMVGHCLLGAQYYEERMSKECASANSPDAVEGSQAPSNSAAPSTGKPTTPTVSERSAESSAKPSSSPSTPTSASTAAPAETVMEAVSASAAGLARQRNLHGLCASPECMTSAADFNPTAVSLRPGIGGLAFCHHGCYRTFLVSERAQ